MGVILYPAYEKVHNECEAEIIEKNVEFCKGFKIEVNNERNMNLPDIYMMLKFHKRQVSFKFISASVGSLLKF